MTHRLDSNVTRVSAMLVVVLVIAAASPARGQRPHRDCGFEAETGEGRRGKGEGRRVKGEGLAKRTCLSSLLSPFSSLPSSPSIDDAVCLLDASPSGESPLSVWVGIPPVAYLVERLGGEHVAVEVLVRPGRDPHAFEPTPRQMLALSRAKLFVKIGLPIEERLLEMLQGQQRGLIVVDAARGISRRTLACTGCGHGHGHDSHHHHHDGHDDTVHDDHAAADLHVWLSPPLLKIQAANVAKALERADPQHADLYRTNLAALLEEIDAIHARIALAMQPCRGQTFYVFHPAFGYFGDAYGLKQASVQIADRPPTLRQLRGLIKRAMGDGVKIIFVQPQFDRHRAEVIARLIGGAVVSIDPLARDVLKNLDDMAMEIRKALH